MIERVRYYASLSAVTLSAFLCTSQHFAPLARYNTRAATFLAMMGFEDLTRNEVLEKLLAHSPPLLIAQKASIRASNDFGQFQDTLSFLDGQ